MKDTRLTAEELDVVVQYAYGGAAYRAGRQAQARAINNLIKGKSVDATGTETVRTDNH